MTTLEQDRLYTADDLWALAADEAYQHVRLELVQGELYVMTPEGGEHGGLAFDSGYALRYRCDQLGIRGQFFAAETGFYLNPTGTTVRAADVAFVAEARLIVPVPRKFYPAPPDFVLEVVSPGDKPDPVYEKVQMWLTSGVRMVWVQHPARREIEVYTPAQASPQTHTLQNTLTGGDVFPGLMLPVAVLFPR